MVTVSDSARAAAQLPALGRRQTLRERVRNALRAAVISGELAPGSTHSAASLGRRFGVSSTPVREAMLNLVTEGLVEARPNRGFHVTEVSERDLDEVTEVRLLLEPPTVRAVVPRVPQADLPRLRALAEAIVTAARHGDLVGYVEADRVFHLTLLEYADNRRLLDIVSGLRARTRLLGLAPLVRRGTLVESAAEHHRILDRVAAGDAVGAEEWARRHIGHVRGLWATGTEPDTMEAEPGTMTAEPDGTDAEPDGTETGRDTTEAAPDAMDTGSDVTGTGRM